ncbi:hypothetical protein ALI22I_14650 [Saccharothrix sp. ALI-22-I]|nr:hypothetical protein ALI22I_14650 [Saccharothrix sp. ALI-22-I]
MIDATSECSTPRLRSGKLALFAGKPGADEQEEAAVVLATARRHIVIDTALAWSLLTDFRIAPDTAGEP